MVEADDGLTACSLTETVKYIVNECGLGPAFEAMRSSKATRIRARPRQLGSTKAPASIIRVALPNW